MTRSVYIINPVADFPSFWGADFYGARGFDKSVIIADLVITTVAGLLPRDFEIRLCDEALTPVDFDAAPDYVLITGKVSQARRMLEIAKRFRDQGCTVIIGGAYASLSPARMRPHCDVVVRGEIEDIADDFAADLRSGKLKEEYVGTKPDLANTRVPRWDLYPNHLAQTGMTQYSRGCPFDCEFCDVIAYLGRNQRYKPVGLVLRELDELYRHGHRFMMFADDNLTANRAKAKELFTAVKAWNERQVRGSVCFTTQLSVEASKDDELLRMASECGLIGTFIGLETPNQDSLVETSKRPNLSIKYSTQEAIGRFLDYGIGLFAGIIVGFDSDGPSIFETQYDFCMSLPIPLYQVSTLVAPDATPLRARLEKEGRLPEGEQVFGSPWASTYPPKLMSSEMLTEGMRWLMNKLYNPRSFEERVMNFIDRFGQRLDPALWKDDLEYTRPPSITDVEVSTFGPTAEPHEREMFERVYRAADKKPATHFQVDTAMRGYLQTRLMLETVDFWDPDLAEKSSPF